MSDPRILSVFSAVFILLGAYNVFNGIRRMRAARARNQRLVWYKQINILTGTEYILLALVFLLSIGFNAGILPSSLKSIVISLYLVLLVAAAILAGLVIRQGISNTRQARAQSSPQTVRSNGTSKANQVVEADSIEEEHTVNTQRRRARRKNAAAARRRRAGKA
jgi:protein-S-isoprenylcysteine O-methyltransferase Ste14